MHGQVGVEEAGNKQKKKLGRVINAIKNQILSYIEIERKPVLDQWFRKVFSGSGT